MNLHYLLLLSSLGRVVCWDLATGATVEHKCYDGNVTAVCFAGDHVVTASASEDSVHMWSVPSCMLHHRLLLSNGTECCEFS